MADTVNQYLATVERGLRGRVPPERLRSLRSEIADHLNSKRQDLIREGIAPDSAEKAAIESFGRPYLVIESELGQSPLSGLALKANRFIVALVAALTAVQLSFLIGRPIFPGRATLLVTVAGMLFLFGASCIAQRVHWRPILLVSIPIFVVCTGVASTTERYGRWMCSLGSSIEYAVSDRNEMREKTAEIKSQAANALDLVRAGKVFFAGSKPRLIPAKFKTPDGHLLELPAFRSFGKANTWIESGPGKGPYLLNFVNIPELESYRFDSTDSWNAACALWQSNAAAWISNLDEVVDANPVPRWLRGVNFWLYLLSFVIFWLTTTLVPNSLGAGLGRIAGKVSRRIRYA